jgi:hypothetical protein
MPKPADVVFDRPVYAETVAVYTIGPIHPDEIARRYKIDTSLYVEDSEFRG